MFGAPLVQAEEAATAVSESDRAAVASS